jgi:hypothetical protein
MDNLYNFYITRWNTEHNTDEATLTRVINRAGEVISNAANILAINLLNVPYYLLDNVKKAVCAQTDYIMKTENGLDNGLDTGESFRIGQFSVSNSTSVKGSVKNPAYELCPEAKLYLVKTNLLNSNVTVRG